VDSQIDLTPGSSPAAIVQRVCRPSEEGGVHFRWWVPSMAVCAMSAVLLLYAATSNAGVGWFEVRGGGWWVLTTALHVPFFVTLFFLVGGLVERLGFYWRGRAPEPAGRLPAEAAGAPRASSRIAS